MSTLFMTREEVEPAKEGQELTYCDERGWYCEETGEFARVKGFGEHAPERAYSEGDKRPPSLDPSPMQADKVNEPPLPTPPSRVELTERAMLAGFPSVPSKPEEPVCIHGPACDLEPEDCPRDADGVPILGEPAHHWRIDPASPSRTYTIEEPRHVNGMTYSPDGGWPSMHREDHREPVQPLRPEDRLTMSATSARALSRGLEVATELLDHSDEPAQQLAILDRLVKLASALDRASTNSHVQGEDTAATVSGVSLSS
jgi:hypothetical protein